MPKINRVRIVNFSYNNNNRHIMDETFNFFGGENVLLSLANGGGKSVLVQVMLQPILPKITMLGRKIGDFFIGKNTPSYILLEWKLDDNAGYLMTGIAMVPNAVHSANEEEQAANIRYYTFYHEYEQGNELDIKNIPVAQETGNHLRIASYTEFRKFLQKEADKAPQYLGYFASDRDSQRKYQGVLKSYGISIDEWKELMVRINEAEHGVSEVFSKCRTSKMVMEQWIIKYIEDVLNKSDTGLSDHKKLETMMSQVASSMVDNEQHTREYEKITAFISDVEGIYDQTRNVLTSMDEEIELKRRIRTGLYVIQVEGNRLEEESARLVQDNIRFGEQMEHINLEEKSLEIYNYKDELAALEEKLSSLTDKLEQKREALNMLEHKLTVQKAAERYKFIQDKEQRLAALRERLANEMKSQDQLAKDLNKVRFSLKLAYQKVLTDFDSDIESHKESMEACQMQIGALNKEVDSCQTQLQELYQDLGGLQREIKHFESWEPIILNQLGLELYRNPLIKEIIKEDLEKAQAGFEKRISDLGEEIENRNKEIENLASEIFGFETEKERLTERQLNVKAEAVKNEQSILAFENERDKVIAILKAYHLPEMELFNKSLILKRIQDKIDDWYYKAFHLRMSIGDIDKLLNGIEEGASYLPPRLTALLREHNLPCYTGEQYLKELNDSQRRELLDSNPLLPYALILTDKEFNKISELLLDEEISQLVPTIRYQDRDLPFCQQDMEGVRFLASARMMRMDLDNIHAYVKEIENKKAGLLGELEQAESVLEDTRRDYQIIDQFGWHKDQVDDLYSEKIRLEGQLEDLDKHGRQLQAKMAACRENQNKLGQTVQHLDKALAEAIRHKDIFDDFIKQDSEYMKNLSKLSRVNSEMSSVLSKIELIKSEILEHDKKLQSHKDGLKLKILSRNDYERKYNTVKDAEDAEILDSTLNELEGKLAAYQGRQTSQVGILREQVEEMQQDISREEQQLQRLGLRQEDYQDVTYDRFLEQELETEIRDVKFELTSLEKEYNREDKKKFGIESNMSMAEKDLKGKQLVPLEEIRGDFDSRRQCIQDKIKHNKTREVENRKSLDRINKLVTIINTKIPDILEERVDNKELPSYLELDTAIETMLNQYDSKKADTQNQIDRFKTMAADLKSKYKEDPADIVYDAYSSIQAQIDGLERTYEKYYYLSERLDTCSIRLHEILKIMEGKVQQLEHDRKDLVEHAFMEVMRIYREIPKIAENSSVEIDGVRRRILEIQYDEIEDELAAKEKMADYINSCLEILTALIKNSEDESRIRRELEKFLSTKELLNVVSNLENCVVKAYKVDLNEKNRKMMPWEDIIVKNSGGEKFVAYFSLLVALISYSRGRSRDTLMKTEEAKVLIMDNPFGPITSGHLLKPMFDIAEKYNTQLICLSDIKQGSVLNCFNLMYMIKIHKNMMKDEYLEFEPHMLLDLKAEESLESAYFRSEQTYLFDYQ
jgi:energy-coupling factor transporter ATP-binding protein EcfA2